MAETYRLAVQPTNQKVTACRPRSEPVQFRGTSKAEHPTNGERQRRYIACVRAAAAGDRTPRSRLNSPGPRPRLFVSGMSLPASVPTHLKAAKAKVQAKNSATAKRAAATRKAAAGKAWRWRRPQKISL